MVDQKDHGPKRSHSSGWKYLHLGTQFAVTVGLFALLGYWLDGRYGWSPWGTAGCGMMGVAVGMYHFLKESL